MFQNDNLKRAIFGVTGISAVLGQVLPAHTIAAKVFMLLAGLGGSLGLLSGGTLPNQPPGLR